jgi:DNA primase
LLVFRKKETLFGADIASKYSRESSCVILVEGYFDVIALYEIGMRNVVASMGTSLSLQQMLLASQLSSTGTVILLFDQDAAGVKALQRVEEILEKQESKRKRDVPDIESLEWRVKAGSMKDAIKFLMQRYSSNDEMIQKFEKIKDCADLSLAVSKDEAVDAMIYLAEQARPIKETV